MYGLKADATVGYTYRAETLCPTDVVEALIASGLAAPAARDMNEEEALDQIAGANCIDREDESTFDSDEFPKVVFSVQVEDDERCDRCGQSMIGA